MYIPVFAMTSLRTEPPGRKTADLQLLAQSSSCFGRSRCLNSDDFDEVNDSTNVLGRLAQKAWSGGETYILLVLLARQSINLDRYGRVCVFLLPKPSL